MTHFIQNDSKRCCFTRSSVGVGTRSIEFGEATDAAEDWDVVSFDGLSSRCSDRFIIK